MTKSLSPEEKRIIEALDEVKDPEIPVISVVDLGIIIRVEADEKNARVTMAPTFVGCPAIDYMRAQIRQKVEELGFETVEVIVDREHHWSTNDISARGKQQLKDFKLAPPAPFTGEYDTAALKNVLCPHCGSADTSLASPFGSTLCRAMHYCNHCRLTFEQFKPK